MVPVLNTVSKEAFFILIVSLLTRYTLLLKFSGLLSHVWPIVPCLLDSAIEAHIVIVTICAIMNFPKSVISLLIADAPSQDSAKEAIV
ncbi:hypothetical protein SLE2022_141830 [Rubroshorea leprosula]